MSLVIAYSRTEVPSDKTASEIETMLQKAGVTKTGKQYESGHVKSLYFQMDTPQGSLPFRLPVNVDAVYQLMMNQYKNSAQFRYDQQYQDTLKRRVYSQAERTAWRIVHWWVKSQLALIQLNMVEISEVFLPYMLVSPNHTLYSQLKGRGDFKALVQGQQPGLEVRDEVKERLHRSLAADPTDLLSDEEMRRKLGLDEFP